MADPTFNTLIVPTSGIISFNNDAPGSSNLPSLSSSARIVYTAGGGLTITSKVSSMEKFAVEGRLGTLFTVTDAVSGALFQLRDVTGFPIVEFLDNGDLVTTGSITAVEGNSQEWSSVYTTTQNNSASWEESTDIIPTVTNYLSSNNVLLSAATVRNLLSALDISVLRSLTASEIYSTGSVGIISDNENEPGYGLNTLTLAFLSGVYVKNNLTALGVLSTAGGDSNNWNSVYSTTRTNSAGWESVESTVNSNSANWNSVYTTTQNNSAGWESVESTVNSNSANWNSVYTTTQSNSAGWESVETTVRSLSDAWEESTFISDVAAVSANWNSNYTTTQNNSAVWNSGIYNIVSTNFSIISTSSWAVSTSNGSVQGTLPPNPINGTTIKFLDASKTWATNNFTIIRNGQSIESLSEDLICDISGYSFSMTYIGGSTGWRVY